MKPLKQQRLPMTAHACAICGYGSLVRSNFKFDRDRNPRCRDVSGCLGRMKERRESAHSFVGSSDDWEQRVFVNAVLFRMHRFSQGARDQSETSDFVEAVRVCREALVENPHARIIIYAVTEQGRFVSLPLRRWDHYLAIWRERNVPKHATGES